MTRVLAFDVGFNLGSALILYDAPAVAHTFHVPGSVRELGLAADAVRLHVQERIANLFPDVIAVAEPWLQRFPPPTASAIRPLFGFETIIEMVAYQFKVEMVEVNEQEARGYFMDPVPKKRADRKRAAEQVCRDRWWTVDSDDAADACVIAGYVLALREPTRQHELMPLYQKRMKADHASTIKVLSQPEAVHHQASHQGRPRLSRRVPA